MPNVRTEKLINVRTGSIVNLPVQAHHNNNQGIAFYLNKRDGQNRPVFMRDADYSMLPDAKKAEMKKKPVMSAPVQQKPAAAASLAETFLSASDADRKALVDLIKQDLAGAAPAAPVEAPAPAPAADGKKAGAKS